MDKLEYAELISNILKDRGITTEKGLDRRAKELKKIPWSKFCPCCGNKFKEENGELCK